MTEVAPEITDIEVQSEDFKRPHCYKGREMTALCGFHPRRTFKHLPYPPPNTCPICLALWNESRGLL